MCALFVGLNFRIFALLFANIRKQPLMVVCEYSRTIYRKVPVIFCKKKTVPRPLLIIYDLHLSPQAQQRKFLLILSLLFFPPKTAIPSGGYPADNFPEVISKSRCSDCKNLSQMTLTLIIGISLFIITIW